MKEPCPSGDGYILIANELFKQKKPAPIDRAAFNADNHAEKYHQAERHRRSFVDNPTLAAGLCRVAAVELNYIEDVAL